jgi:hypothetical protein
VLNKENVGIRDILLLLVAMFIASIAHGLFLISKIVPIGFALFGLSYILITIYSLGAPSEVDVFKYSAYTSVALLSVWILYNQEALLNPREHRRKRRRRRMNKSTDTQ